MGGIETVAAVRADLAARLPSQNKKQREGLALLVATALDVRSVNLMELAAAVPRAAERVGMRYQWISRLLGNARIDVEAVMAPYAREVLARACAGSRTLVVIIDQSKVNDAHHMVMVSLRVGERALPLAWRVKKTQGAIGFREQRDALATVAALMPEGVRPTLMGDRFYGSPALIAWCRDHGWGWRLRCKQDLRVFDNGGETTLADCFARGEHRLEDVALTGKRARTHVAMVHADGQAEPWIIAMSDRPTPGRARDYGLRWGIEAMFSDFKTRGFNLEASQIERTDRLDRLVLVLALALYWAVSTGMWDALENRAPAEKSRGSATQEFEITTANVHDAAELEAVLPPEPGDVYGDSAFAGARPEEIIRARGGTPCIVHTSTWGGPDALARLEAHNAEVRRIRARIEKVFGTWKRCYGLRRMRWLGLARAGLQVRLGAMAYNLRRSWRLLGAPA